MWNWIKQLDGILRGDATRLPALREGRIDMPVGGVMIVATTSATPLLSVAPPPSSAPLGTTTTATTPARPTCLT